MDSTPLKCGIEKEESSNFHKGTVPSTTSTALIEKKNLDIPGRAEPGTLALESSFCNSMSPDSVSLHPDNSELDINVDVNINMLAHMNTSITDYDSCLQVSRELELGRHTHSHSHSPKSTHTHTSKQMQIQSTTPLPLGIHSHSHSNSNPIPHSHAKAQSPDDSSMCSNYSQENISPNSCIDGFLSRPQQAEHGNNVGKSIGKSILGMQAPVSAIQIPADGQQHGHELGEHAHGHHDNDNDDDDASLEEPRGEYFCLTPPTPANVVIDSSSNSITNSNDNSNGNSNSTSNTSHNLPAVADVDDHIEVEQVEDRDDASTSHAIASSPPFMPELSPDNEADNGGENSSGSGSGKGGACHEEKSVGEQSQISLTPRRGRCFADDDKSLLLLSSASVDTDAFKTTIDNEHAKSPIAQQAHPNVEDDDEPNLAGESFIDVGEAMPMSMQETQEDGYEHEHELGVDVGVDVDVDDNLPIQSQSPKSDADVTMKLDESFEWSRMACECENAGDYSSALQYYEMCWDLICFASPYNSDGDAHENQILVRNHCRRMASMLKSIGTLQWKSGEYERSLKILTMSRTTIEEAISFSDQFDRDTFEMKEELCEVLNTIGRVHLSLGKPHESLRYHKKAVSIITSLHTGKFGDGAGTGMDKWDEMAMDDRNLYGDRGYDSDMDNDNEQSRNLYSPRSDASEPKKVAHPVVARAMILMGIVQSSRGQFSIAMSNFKEGLILQRQVLGSSHVDIAATMNAIGALYEKTGQLEKAMQCYKKARKIYTQQLGENHVDYAVTMNNMGQIYHQAGKPKKAMQLYREALRIMRQVLGRNHRNIASTLYNMGLVHLQCCQFDKASKMFKDTLRVQREALGDFHVDVALTLEVLGGIYERRRRIDKALQLYHKALRIRQTVSPEHICVAFALDRIGKFQLNVKGDIRESIECFDEALQIYRINGVAEDDPLVLHVIRNLSKASDQLEDEEQKKRRLR